ncbi:MAG: hypothetical protein GF383_15795 [Candidatus Lokiarchaeota archaeon]|nr:hypothetical protein [Candidatus Lokiarchaeota archaeon]MBD3343163.1 hypothetical protein [Candidatus Lokiarchaeota archaeon]
MRLYKTDKSKERYQLLIVLFSLILSVSLAIFFIFILQTSIVFSHFFYIPIILACLWFKRKGLIIPIFLSVLILFLPFYLHMETISLISIDNLLRALLLMGIGVVVVSLSERISESQERLHGRVKELNCLYGIIKSINNPNQSIEEILTSTLEKIRCAWQFPNIICVQIKYNDEIYTTNNYQHTRWKISREVRIKQKLLSIKISYLEEQVFTPEEIELLEEILAQLKAVFDLKLTWIQ